MRHISAALALLTVLAVTSPVGAQTAPTNIIREVRATIADQNFAAGEALIDQYRAVHGVTSEMIAALSWLARGTYAAGQLDMARQYSVDTHALAVSALDTGSLEDDYDLEIALGAAIETDALVRAARGDRSSAVYFLEREIETYRDTKIHKRLQKNLHLLSLEGQPAPAIVAPEYLGSSVQTLDQLRGNVVLLFFWAHWCPDCKAQVPAIARLLEKYRSEGLRVVAPTQRFGYIVSGQDAPPDEELRHIEQVQNEHYAFLRNESVPVGDANLKRYGVSTTPTLVLVDREGIVRLYRPGNLSEDDLDAAIRELL
ncbi:MAG: TlpA disulfide reductase family protein [Acidobacteria bacterium]|nr:TlpA disulfide reductase family protein [Acidobacteriota bacterium]